MTAAGDQMVLHKLLAVCQCQCFNFGGIGKDFAIWMPGKQVLIKSFGGLILRFRFGDF